MSQCFTSKLAFTPVSAARPPSTREEEEEEEEETRFKRKREDEDEDGHSDNKDEEEEERGEIKKVCKEGFQLFHHNVCLFFSLITDEL